MAKLTELAQDEFLDAFLALHPVVSALLDTEFVRAVFIGEAGRTLEKAKLSDSNTTKTRLTGANQWIDAIRKDIGKLYPVLLSKEYRGNIREFLAIVRHTTADEVAKWPPAKLIATLKEAFAETDWKSFLAYAESSDLTE